MGGPGHGQFWGFNVRPVVQTWEGGGGELLGILGGGVPPGSPNADPISDQKM